MSGELEGKWRVEMENEERENVEVEFDLLLAGDSSAKRSCISDFCVELPQRVRVYDDRSRLGGSQSLEADEDDRN